jgi:hypothetical protein
MHASLILLCCLAATKESPRKSKFSAGEKIEARYGGKAKWFGGTVIKVNADYSDEIKYGVLNAQETT